MSHTLTFSRAYKSITRLNPVELPNLTVLTGANGSGKSHLLQAIENGSVRTTASPEPRKHISLFDWNSIVPKDSGAYSIGARLAKVEEIVKRFEGVREQMVFQLQTWIDQHNMDRDLIFTLDDVRIACDPAQHHAYQTDEARRTASHVSSWTSNHLQYFLNAVGNDEPAFRQAVRDTWQRDRNVLLFGDTVQTRSLLLSAVDVHGNVFSQAFAKIFVEYMHKWQENELAKAAGSPHLSEGDFYSSYHTPPWDFVNDILERSSLPFRITSPSRTKFLEPFEPKLVKSEGEQEMSFQDLSSGERVLMSFALCVYNSFARQASVSFPKLLLLDEVDAPLHPEMVSIMLGVIQDILVEKHAIKVVLTTHKPTTVALAPEESIFQVFPQNPDLLPIRRERAVSILTVGVPTIAFTTDLRLQVFTESRVDAHVYNSVYQLYKSAIQSNRSLEFIPSGRRVPQGDRDAGRSRVNYLVGKLRESGVSTVLGVVDWDEKDNSSPYVYEVCKGRRYSIENLFLDPVLLISLLCKEFVPFSRSRGILESSESYASVLGWKQDRWQTAVSRYEDMVFDAGSDETETTYLNGMVLKVLSSSLTTRGHDLVSHMKVRLPVLKRYQDDDLIIHIADTVLPDVRDIAPLEILELLRGLTDLGERSYEQ